MQAGVTSNFASGSGRPHGCGNQQKQHHDRQVQHAKELVPDFNAHYEQQEKQQKQNVKSISLGEKRKLEMMKEKKKDFKDFMRKKKEERVVPVKRRKVSVKDKEQKDQGHEMPLWSGNAPIQLNHSQRRHLLEQNQQKQRDREDRQIQHVQNHIERRPGYIHSPSFPIPLRGRLYQEKLSMLHTS